MMPLKTKREKGSWETADGGRSNAVDWELRPCGMLVQKRTTSAPDQAPYVAPRIRVRVKYGSALHEIHLSSQATFGELKKLLAGPTGLDPQDQKLFYKDKEKDSNAFLDSAGVKDRSKIVLVEDPLSKERRCLELQKNAKMERASKSISEIGSEVDKLARQVAALDSVISKGGKVAEREVMNLIELLMTQLLKLDAIVAEGDMKSQRKMQVRRVQKYVEMLDLLKIQNAKPSNGREQPPRPTPAAAAPVPAAAPPAAVATWTDHKNDWDFEGCCVPQISFNPSEIKRKG
ncbi:BAG molecular chaperone regulator 1 [Asimina triloba]